MTMSAIRGVWSGGGLPVRLPALILLVMAIAVPSWAPAGDDTASAVPGGRIKDVTIARTPYHTNIEAVFEGAIGNYNAFKLDDPFRIVVDVWGTRAGTVAPEIPVETPQVKTVRLAQQDDRLRILVETPGDRPLPFLVSTEDGTLMISVGGGQEEKVTSMDRPAETRTASGPAVVGVDLEDLPEASNVVITTAGGAAHEIVRTEGSVTVVFPDASAGRNLLREIDARPFAIPVKKIVPGAGRKGVRITVAFAPGSSYETRREGDAVILSFPKRAGTARGSVVARLAETRHGAADDHGRDRPAKGAPPAPDKTPGTRQWGFLSAASYADRTYTGQRISLDFKDADLANVFRIIAEVSNINIITTDDVKGRVSVRLINVPWDQALDIILRAKSLGATQYGNVLRIAPLSAIRAEERARLDAQKEVEKLQAQLEGDIETIPVNYGKASDLQVKVKDLLSEGGKIQVDDRTNVIVIRDLRKNLEDAKALIAQLDMVTPQVLIEARIVEVDTSFTRELGVQWGGSYHNNGGTQFGMTGIQNPSGAFIPGQPLLNVPPFSPTGTPVNYAVNLPASVGLGSGGGLSFGILRDNLRLDLSLSALEASGRGKVISSPKVVTIDNREALIEQGTQIPYTTVSAAGTQTQFVDAVLSLKVTPHITPAGSVIMKLEAKNDSPGELSVSGQPAINKKKATTEVLIQDGETAVIGGILQISRNESLSAVPWFSKIPVLGFFFKKSTTAASNRELLIFVTPKILKPETAEARTF
jgi:type IV pilus assembly protein PilQ